MTHISEFKVSLPFTSASFQMMSAIKTGAVSHSRFAKMTETDYEYGGRMERSGGGV